MEEQQNITEENAEIFEDRIHEPQPFSPQQSYIRVAFHAKPAFMWEFFRFGFSPVSFVAFFCCATNR